jgi:hypothetical protein
MYEPPLSPAQLQATMVKPSLLEDHLSLEQMYLKTAPKILVFAPNCWETLTEFSRHYSRTGT